MIHETSTQQRTGTTNQPCLFVIRKRFAIGGSFGCPDQAIQCIQDTGLPLYAAGQKEPQTHPGSGAIGCIYRQTGTQPDRTDKICSFFYGPFYQQNCKNGIGRVFIKTRPWLQKRDKLNFPAGLTGLVSKSSPRFTVSLFGMLPAMM